MADPPKIAGLTRHLKLDQDGANKPQATSVGSMADAVSKSDPSGKPRTSINDLSEDLVYEIFSYLSLLECEESGLQFSRKDFLEKIGASRVPFVMRWERPVRSETQKEVHPDYSEETGPSRVQTLRFDNAALTPTYLRGVLRACSDLKQVYFRWEAPVRYGVFGKVLEALELCSQSLDSITLVYSDSYKVWEDAIRHHSVRNPLGSFKVFQNLKKLTIAGVFLTGVPELDWSNIDRHRPISRADVDYRKLADIFPASLEQLGINCEGLVIASAPSSLNNLVLAPETGIEACGFTYLVPFLEEVASDCILNRLPNFRRLGLSVLYSPGRPFFHQVETLMAQANVEVKFTGFVEDGTPNPGEEIRNSIARWHESAERYAETVAHRKKITQSEGCSKKLYDLPNELMAEIISYFDPSGIIATDPDDQEGPNFALTIDYRTDLLAQICLVSKQFCALARPLLYKVFLDNGDSERRLSYINTISANPQLAAYVCETSFITADPMALADDTLRPAKMEGTYDHLLAKAEIIKNLDVDYEMDWLTDLLPQRRSMETDVELPILLAQTTNLEVLRFHLRYEKFVSEFYWTLIFSEAVSIALQQGKFNACRPAPLGKLGHISFDLGGVDIDPEEFEDALQEVLRLPSLRKLKLLALKPLHDSMDTPLPHHTGDGGVHERPKYCPSRSSNVEALDLDIPGVGPVFLRHMVEACIALKSFKFTYSEDSRDTEATGVPPVIECLRSHKDSLERLDLSIDRKSAPLQQPIGSLEEFVCLKHVKIEAGFFLKHYDDPIFWPNCLFALPPSIETLTIGGTKPFWPTFGKWLQEHVDRLIRGDYPNLRSVTLLDIDPGTLRQNEFFRGVHPSLLDVGVKLKIDDWDPERFTRDIEDMAPHVLEEDYSIDLIEYYDPAEDEDEEYEEDEDEEEDIYEDEEDEDDD
ncbi:hypothetical protein SLS56_003783 [Neofusicoccum ribis]|uniref:Leucine-rich repeat domain-containing protein n=1 Tax=Neofusicoccum ribis TaxID=45134 RepID=A0ABR3SYE7_9PEZI